MNDMRQCKDRFEDIVALVMGELDPAASRELREHISRCDRCRETHDVLIEEEEGVRSGFEALARSLGRVEHAAFESGQNPSRVRVGVSNDHFLERTKNMILAHKRLVAAATAAAAALAAGAILAVSLLSSATAYALEQTAQANDHVTSYHVKVTPPPTQEGLGEAWVELNPDGTVLRARVDVFGGGRGDRVVFLSRDRVAMWFKPPRNFYVIPGDKEVLGKGRNEVKSMRTLYDPKLAFEQLQADEKAGKVHVATKEPAKEGESITLTVTSKAKPDRRQVYEVHPKTKLVERVVEYRGGGDRWEQVSRREYLDYNKPIDPKVFEPELPKDVTVMDQTKMDLSKIGLAQGNLTDEEIAVQLAEEGLEAFIAGDYQRAGQLYDGIPGERLKRDFEQRQIKYLRILEIGKPTVVKDPRAPGFKIMNVPVKVEMETKGNKAVEELRVRVRPLDKNSDRWSIGGL